MLNPSGTMTSSAAGAYAQNEDYIHTLEAYQLFFQRLRSDGLFIVSQWIRSPARSGLKLFFTGFEMLQRLQVPDPENHLALIRNWDWITLLIKKTPLRQDELRALKTFCLDRNIDVSYYPGIRQHEPNRFNKLPEPIYYKGALSIIDPLTRAQFVSNYPFQINPATDNRPYFSNFFRWGALPHLFRTLGTEWVPFADHGFLFLLVTFTQIILLGGLFILIPVGCLVRKRQPQAVSLHPSIWVYFMALGGSYMLLEIALIQKFILFLHHPIYASSVVIASFLILSGWGSQVGSRFLGTHPTYALVPFAAILSLGTVYAFGLDPLFAKLSWMSIHARNIAAVFILSPLAFFMGMPFPLGMQRIVSIGERATGLAWGCNGFFSVVGGAVTPLLAAELGFRQVAIIGCCGYFIALIIWRNARGLSPL